MAIASPCASVLDVASPIAYVAVLVASVLHYWWRLLLPPKPGSRHGDCKTIGVVSKKLAVAAAAAVSSARVRFELSPWALLLSVINTAHICTGYAMRYAGVTRASAGWRLPLQPQPPQSPQPPSPPPSLSQVRQGLIAWSRWLAIEITTSDLSVYERHLYLGSRGIYACCWQLNYSCYCACSDRGRKRRQRGLCSSRTALLY